MVETAHGGKRDNAGRPRSDQRKELRSVRIPDEEWESIKTAAANLGTTASALLRRAAYEYGAIPNDERG